MIDNAMRAVLPRFVDPVLAVYRRFGWTPNQVTGAGLAIAVVASLAVAFHFWWAALLIWWISRLVDGTDGIWARASGQTSDFGAYLDITADMAAYGAMVLGFAIARPDLQLWWMAILFLYILCITTALSLGSQEARLGRAPRDDRGLRLGAGLAEGGETGIAYSLFLVFPSQLTLLASAWVVVLVVTVLARSVLALRILSSEPVVSDAGRRSDASPGDPTPETLEV